MSLRFAIDLKYCPPAISLFPSNGKLLALTGIETIRNADLYLKPRRVTAVIAYTHSSRRFEPAFVSFCLL